MLAEPEIPQTMLRSEQASIWSRLLAYILDSIIVGAGGMAVAFALGFAALAIVILLAGDFVSVAEEDLASAIGVGLGITGLVAVQVLYFWLGNASGGTPGKRLLNLRVVDAESEMPIGNGRGLLRVIVWWLGALPLYLGWLWSLWDSDRQAWHDKAAKSVVVRIEPARVGGQAHGTAPKRTRWFIALGVGTVGALGLLAAVPLFLLVSSDRLYESDFPLRNSGIERVFLSTDDCVLYIDRGMLEVVDCAEPHNAVVLEAFTLLSGGPYPGEAEVIDFVISTCPTGTDAHSIPSEEDWLRGDRHFDCLDE